MKTLRRGHKLYKYFSILELVCHMESTSENSYSSVEPTSDSDSSTSSVVSTARKPFRRGISLRACVAKAAEWTLEANKDKIATEHKEVKLA